MTCFKRTYYFKINLLVLSLFDNQKIEKIYKNMRYIYYNNNLT